MQARGKATKAKPRSRQRSRLQQCQDYLGEPLETKSNVNSEVEYYFYHVSSDAIVEMRNKKLLKTWTGNRPLDKDRIAEIRVDQDALGHVLGTLHFAYLLDEGLVCYDGNHRLYALTEGLQVLVHVIWDATPQIVSDFNAKVNAAQSVPEVNKNAELNSLAEIVNEFMAYIEKNYGKLKTTADKRRPRYNVTKFTNRVTELCIAHKDDYSPEEVIEAIKYLNESLGNGTRSIRYTGQTREPAGKDKDTATGLGFYLYFPPNPLSDEDILWALEELY